MIDITHNMDDVMRVSDRIAVMHRGRKAGELITGQARQQTIVHAIMSGQIGSSRLRMKRRRLLSGERSRRR